MNQYGVPSPPPSEPNSKNVTRQNTALPGDQAKQREQEQQESTHTGNMSSSSHDDDYPTSPSENNQLAPFYAGQQSESPAPVDASPYPVSRATRASQQGDTPTGSTVYLDRQSEISQNLEELEEFRRWKLDQMRKKEFEQRRGQQVQMRPQYGPPTVMPRNPEYVQPNYMQGSAFGPDGSYPDLGQMHGLPGRSALQSQQYQVRPGHRYGTVIATGNARVVRGNVVDPGRGGHHMIEKQHDYGDALFRDKARVFDGNVTTDDMKGFWNQD